MGVSGARRGREKERRKNYLMCLGKKEKREKGKIETERGGVKEGGRGGGVKDTDIQHEIILLGC